MDFNIAMRLPARLARLSFLQAVLPSGSHSVAPLSRDMSRWFADLPSDKPLVILDNLTQRAASIASSSESPSKRFRQIEQMLNHAEPLLKRFETQLDQCRLPLDTASRHASEACDRLLKALSEACVKIVQAMDGSALQRHLHGKIFGAAILRAAQLIHRRAAIAQRARSAGSPRRWKMLRRLLLLAEAHNLSRIPAFDHDTDTVEQVVVRDCLLALCDPASLEGAELSRLRFYIARFGHLATLSAETPAPEDLGPGMFVFSDAERGPGKLKPGQALLDKERLLDCRQLVDRIQQQLAGLRQGLHATKLGLPMVANEASYAFMLTRCAEQWSDSRSSRKMKQDYQPLATLITGFDPVRQYLSSGAWKSLQNGRPRVVGAIPAVACEWRIFEQARTGFSLREAGPHTLPINVGELVAMRPLERASVHLSIVRRARSHETTGKEISLERLCGTALPHTIDKKLPDGNIQTLPVLLLPRVQCFEGNPGLLAPHGDLKPGVRITVEQREGNVTFEVVAVVEKLASCELAQLKRV
ncbi:MAG: hypothetical protein QM776_17920 [Rhodocyclaceae bacterium]